MTRYKSSDAIQDLKDWALYYAEVKGWAVFPLMPRGKNPAIKKGFLKATTDTNQIEAWWGENPNYNIGIPALPNGFVVIDVDAGLNKDGTPKVGEESLETWGLIHGAFPDTAKVLSGGGGAHYFYTVTEEEAQSFKQTAGWQKDIDTRVRGYVVAPPSVHESGVLYKWENPEQEAAPLSGSALEYMRQSSKGKTTSADQGAICPISSMGQIGEGSRNDTLFRLASKLQSEGYSDAHISAMIKGLNSSCCSLPLPSQEIEQIVTSATERYAKGDFRRTSTLPALVDSSTILECPPPRKPIIGALAVEGGVTLVAGAAGVGKSYLCIEAAIACAYGEPFLGWETVQGDVVFINPELTPDIMSRRICEVGEALGHELPIEGVYALNLRGVPLDSLDQVATHVVERCEDSNISPVLVIADSLYMLTDGDENSAGDVTANMRALGRIAEGLNAAVLFTHHFSKGAQSSKSAIDRASGSGAYGRFADVVLTLNELSTKGITPPEHEGEALPTAFRAEFGKTRDTAKPAPLNLWFCFPLHKADTLGLLDEAKYADTKTRVSVEAAQTEKETALIEAYSVFREKNPDIYPTLRDFANLTKNPDTTVRGWLKRATVFEALTEGKAHRFRLRDEELTNL